jgi:hypothetical protein
MSNLRHGLASAAVIVTLVAACGGSGQPAGRSGQELGPAQADAPLDGSGDVSRSTLTFDQLTSGFEAASPVDEAALALPGDAAQPQHLFEGRLELLGEAAGGGFQLLRGQDAGADMRHLPEFDFAFAQSGSYLIPARRGLIITPYPNWNYILEPGRVWSERGDGGWSRASFPFALVARNGNGTLNGTMTFVFTTTGVSQVWYQVTQETTTNTSANWWGLLKATYHPAPVAGAQDIRRAFARELAERFPTRPIERLAEDYPGVDVSAFGRGVTPERMTWYGLVVNGINYVGGCRTRYGQYPYCESMRAASYSTAKSAFVALALLRLAQKYGPQVAGLLIKDYVPEAARSPGDWSQVTFDHTLDMATGNFRSAAYMADEEGRIFDAFFGAETRSDKMAIAFDWPRGAAPGTRWVYRSSDTFIVTAAMQNYLRNKEGASADIFQFVVDEVYTPMKLGPGVFSTTRTSENGWQGQPIGSFGMWWTADDIAKIATLLANQGAQAGAQILHPGLLAAALQRDPADRGVDIGPGAKYNDAFWSARYGPSAGYACEFWVPYMAGYSGNVVALMPNGAAYYYFSDGREFTWNDAVREANKIAPHCR